eukprot:CAMPEP_0201586116 /NCGR_PEP_ID=MMETSP0190_2-20130828/129282_1 /ASSEMBLY_ACC=CAM_ASM_000263 /TAXON_ID=37353 /ORGANISM="Rosalina sp." /LENGTH=92 /DNA_ID=CAMNT_0048033451 /DNA_START=518 /DNA_END=792 /DNA_ORIENTATION=-
MELSPCVLTDGIPCDCEYGPNDFTDDLPVPVFAPYIADEQHICASNSEKDVTVIPINNMMIPIIAIGHEYNCESTNNPSINETKIAVPDQIA